MKKLNILVVTYLIFFQFVAFAAEPFRFALFTDLHIAANNPLPSEDLQNAVNDVNALRGIEFVLVTGDITHLGDTTSLKEAKLLLRNLKMPYYIVPGNHDFRWNIGNGAADFIRVFGDDKFIFTHKNFVFVGFPTVPLEKSGNAYIQENDSKWIKKQLKKEGKNIPVFVVTHYPLLSGDVDNWKTMTKVLKEFNVQAVLIGHYHRNVCLNYDGIPGIVNRSTLRGKNAVGGYSIYTISDSIQVFEKKIGQTEDKWLTLPMNVAK